MWFGRSSFGERQDPATTLTSKASALFRIARALIAAVSTFNNHRLFSLGLSIVIGPKSNP
jgi:hypothetical protein